MSVIEIGIDLGTTNSEIAVFNKGKVEIVKNALGDEYTPSVFGINKAGAEEVGKRPYFRCFKDAVKEEFENNKAEIKRLMGTEKKIYFPRAKKEFSPEEISAKILLSLKQDAVRKNEKINAQAAVITYPAYFSTLQAEATKRAGEAAGFKYVVLLQEPIAAAMAYGFKNEQNENILVYDLGGGTFDAALISLRDGNLTALSHNGDNFLGGKDIDNLIVENKIIPVLCGKYNLDGFERKEPKYAPQFAKLKYAAEQAKIQLSQMPSAQIEVDAEIDGENIYESIELSQKDLEEIMENMIARTIELCKKTISDAKIKNSAVDRIIFVGAPTQLPFLKQRLESELSIKADSSSDPFTAIAQGACIFAASQIIPEEFCEIKTADKNRYEIKLQYDPLTSEDSQLITGVFEELKDLPKDYFIQIQSEDNKYNSGRIKLKNGKFAIEIALERKKNNNFWIYLFDAEGRQMDISKDGFSIMQGLSVSGAPIPHSIGIGVSKRDTASQELTQEYDIFFEKNAVLPLEKTVPYKTLRALHKGDAENCLSITIYEGEENIPDRNTFLCRIEINGKNIPYNLKEGEDVDIIVQISESRQLTAKAYIPLIDKVFEARSTIYDAEISFEELESELEKTEEKAFKIKMLCSIEDGEKIDEAVCDARHSVENAENDPDEKLKSVQKLKKLNILLDKIEGEKRPETMKDDFENLLQETESQIKALANSKKAGDFKKSFEALKQDGANALKSGNQILLSKTIEQLKTLQNESYWANDLNWVKAFAYWKSVFHKVFWKNSKQAKIYLDRGEEAVKNNNMDEIKNSLRGLWSLLPPQMLQRNSGGEVEISGVMR